jgi:hypothetical protein
MNVAKQWKGERAQDRLQTNLGQSAAQRGRIPTREMQMRMVGDANSNHLGLCAHLQMEKEVHSGQPAQGRSL